MKKNKKQLNWTCILLFGILLSLLSVSCSGMLDIPGPAVSVTSHTGGYSVAEYNGTLIIELALGREPESDVTIPLSSGDITEFTVSVPSVTFTKKNWHEGQTITISGVDEFVTDGNKDIYLILGAIISSDSSYSGYTKPSVTITVIDNETDSIVVSPTTLSTTESGTGSGACTGANNTATFTVVLGSQPGVNVDIGPIVTDDPSEATISPVNLTFTPANYSIPQPVTVTCVDDNILDGSVVHTITLPDATGGDITYNGMTPSSTVTVTNNDDETASIIVTALDVPDVNVPDTLDLNLTEGGTARTFTVKLNNAPTGTANFAITSADTARATVDKAVLTFNPGVYPQTQTVTVTPVDYDDIDDDTVNTVMIVVGAADANYQNENPPDVTVNISDDDTRGVTVSNLSRDTNDTGQNATFNVRLNSKPTADVSILINETNHVNNNANQSGTISGDPKTLTFTSLNWNINQTVTVNPIVDAIDNENVQYVIKLENCVSADPKYSGYSPIGVTVNYQDTYTAGITVTGSGLVTDDMGNLAAATYSKFSVVLDSEPTANVTLDLASSITTDGTPDKTQLVFTPANWNVVQNVMVHNVDFGDNRDYVQEGNHSYTINFTKTTSDTKYNALSAPSVSIKSCDNDWTNAIIGCSNAGTTTSEGGGTAKVWYITKTQPTANVTVNVSSSDTAEGTVSTPATITTSNWNTLGTNFITATGVDDAGSPTLDGNKQYTVNVTSTTSGDTNYAGITVPAFGLRNVDNEEALVYDTALTTDTEEDGTPISTTYKVKIGIAPTANVTFDLSCGDSTECASISPTTLTFTTANAYQTVTVTGKDDNEADGNKAITVSYTTFNTLDENLNTIQPGNFTGISNLDDDKRIWVTASAFLGNFNSTVSMAPLDQKCTDDANNPGGTYKGLVAHSVFRVATTTGTDATGQTGWVLLPSTKYYQKSGANWTSRVFTTDSFGLVSFNLANGFTGGPSWTGFNSNWTTSTDNCGDWSVSNQALGAAQTGASGAVNSTAITGTTASCFVTNNINRSLICVQQ